MVSTTGRSPRPVRTLYAVLSLLVLMATLGGQASARPPIAGGVVLPAALGAKARQGVHEFGATALQRDRIQHVVIVMQENRSFNYLFKGYNGANTASYGYASNGKLVKLRPISLAAPYDIDHGSSAMFTACDGSPPGEHCKMDGFNREYVGGQHGPHPQYGFAPHAEVKLYWDMAKQYVLADDMHNSNLDASFVSHQYIIAAQANHAVDLPFGAWGCGGGSGDEIYTLTQQRTYGPTQSPCQDYETLGDELEAKGFHWRYYAAGQSDVGYIWSAYQAIAHIFYGRAWRKDVITPPSAFLKDVAKGTLEAVTWVLPTWLDSDHTGNQSTTGPQWVATIVNAVGRSTFWKSSAIFILWDEWGGWYDPVKPPYVDYDGLGFRIPLLIISPYAKQGYVSHLQYEHGSVLRFAENAFGLPPLSAADARANDPAVDCFDFTQRPRRFQPFRTALSSQFFEDRPASVHAVDNQ